MSPERSQHAREEVRREDGSVVTPAHLRQVRTDARVEADRIVEAERRHPTTDGGPGPRT